MIQQQTSRNPTSYEELHKEIIIQKRKPDDSNYYSRPCNIHKQFSYKYGGPIVQSTLQETETVSNISYEETSQGNNNQSASNKKT